MSDRKYDVADARARNVSSMDRLVSAYRSITGDDDTQFNGAVGDNFRKLADLFDTFVKSGRQTSQGATPAATATPARLTAYQEYERLTLAGNSRAAAAFYEANRDKILKRL